MASAPVAPGTRVGTEASVVEPVPSCPRALRPQHFTSRPLVKAHVCGLGKPSTGSSPRRRTAPASASNEPRMSMSASIPAYLACTAAAESPSSPPLARWTSCGRSCSPLPPSGAMSTGRALREGPTRTSCSARPCQRRVVQGSATRETLEPWEKPLARAEVVNSRIDGRAPPSLNAKNAEDFAVVTTVGARAAAVAVDVPREARPRRRRRPSTPVARERTGRPVGPRNPESFILGGQSHAPAGAIVGGLLWEQIESPRSKVRLCHPREPRRVVQHTARAPWVSWGRAGLAAVERAALRRNDDRSRKRPGGS
jgi:hypothetical protein